VKSRSLEIRLEHSSVSYERERTDRRARLTSGSSSFEVNLRKDEIENFSWKHHLLLVSICGIVQGQHSYTGSGLIGIAEILEWKPNLSRIKERDHSIPSV